MLASILGLISVFALEMLWFHPISLWILIVAAVLFSSSFAILGYSSPESCSIAMTAFLGSLGFMSSAAWLLAIARSDLPSFAFLSQLSFEIAFGILVLASSLIQLIQSTGTEIRCTPQSSEQTYLLIDSRDLFPEDYHAVL
jgi:hypothetical protein